MTETAAQDDDAQPLWEPDPDKAQHTAIAAFTRHVEAHHHLRLEGYSDLWRWSVEHLEDFWSAVWDTSDIRSQQPPTRVLGSAAMPGAGWFPGVQLNYVTHVFRDRAPDTVAIVEVTEDGGSSHLSWGNLEQQTSAVAHALQARGVGPGDRVVGYLPNSSAAVVAFLATASLGAVWSACGPDYAARAAADRLAQLEPTVLVCADGYHFGGKRHDRRAEAVALARLLPTVSSVLHVPHLGLPPGDFAVSASSWDDVLAKAPVPLTPMPVPFDHPLWVLYSSGTTGIPEGLGGIVTSLVGRLQEPVRAA